ncbi:glycosyl hydrolase family 18 protein [Arthrobacter methylotrophus]|uniref:Chitinase n=1 Tax=Arthrobacter methylotrophus TaxID=121291 RepID=A0ABV5USN9_9MICC
MSKRFPGRRLSVLRLAILCVIVVAAVTAGYLGLRNVQDVSAAASMPSVFSGYVDVTATPKFAFEDPVEPSAKAVVLSFVVADPKQGCAPSWGAAYSPDQAGSDLDLDRRIARLRQLGGTAAVSFGGLSNTELAVSCKDPKALVDAYRQVVNRYDVTTIDLDIESGALSDTAAADRRAQAISALQKERKAAGKPLAVWLTLAADPNGLTPQGKEVVSHTLAGGVELDGVNIMTMDFGASKPAASSMSQASVSAAEAAHDQLGALYRGAGTDLGSETLWRKLGLTVMIGQNDTAGEIFTLSDATAMNSFAKAKGLGRLSMWSMNRDRTCSPNYPDLGKVSDGCSGINQGSQLFSATLANDVALPAQTVVPSATATAASVPTDDPSTSPYPVWNTYAAYAAADRVVWHGSVYEAKWWTRSDVPDNPVLQGGATPWRLVGPVLPGDKPSPKVTVPSGTFPAWVPETVYHQGDRVLFEGSAFEAKWWTQGASPEAALQSAPDSPWAKLTTAQIQSPGPTISTPAP